jgi:hypothetical protein
MPEDLGTLTSVASLLMIDPHEAMPQVGLDVYTQTDVISDWDAVTDLLDSDAFDNDFVAETDNQGRALIRFAMTRLVWRLLLARTSTSCRIGVGNEGMWGRIRWRM